MRLTRKMIQKWERNKARAEKRHQAKLHRMLEKRLRYHMRQGHMEFYINDDLMVRNEDIEYVKECLRSWGFKASGYDTFMSLGIHVKIPNLEEFDGREK